MNWFIALQAVKSYFLTSEFSSAMAIKIYNSRSGDANLQDYGLVKSRSVHLSTGRYERPVLTYVD